MNDIDAEKLQKAILKKTEAWTVVWKHMDWSPNDGILAPCWQATLKHCSLSMHGIPQVDGSSRCWLNIKAARPWGRLHEDTDLTVWSGEVPLLLPLWLSLKEKKDMLDKDDRDRAKLRDAGVLAAAREELGV